MEFQAIQAMTPAQSSDFNPYVPTGTDEAEAALWEANRKNLGEEDELSADDLDGLADAGYVLND